MKKMRFRRRKGSALLGYLNIKKRVCEIQMETYLVARLPSRMTAISYQCDISPITIGALILKQILNGWQSSSE